MTIHLLTPGRIQYEHHLVVCHAATADKVEWSFEPEMVDCEACRTFYREHMMRYEAKRQRPSWSRSQPTGG